MIIAFNTESEHIDNASSESLTHIPQRGDEIWFKGKRYRVKRRIFQYNDGNQDELEIVNVVVRKPWPWEIL